MKTHLKNWIDFLAGEPAMQIKKLILPLFVIFLLSINAFGLPLSSKSITIKYPFSGRAEIKVTLINDLKEPLIFQSVYKP